MKNPQEDDAVERMLNQLEGLLKRQHDSARASRASLTPLEDRLEPGGTAAHLPQSIEVEPPDRAALHSREADDSRDRHGRAEARIIAAASNGSGDHDDDAIELDAYDPDATAPEMDAYRDSRAEEGAPANSPAADDGSTVSEPDSGSAVIAARDDSTASSGPAAERTGPKLSAVPPAPGGPPVQQTPDGTHLTRRLTTRLGQLLLDADLLSEAQLKKALAEQHATGEKLGSILVREGSIDEADLLAVLAKQHGVPTAKLDGIVPDPALTQMIPADMARRYQLIPMAIGKDAIDVAMVDPTDFVAMAHVRFATGLRPNVFITTATAAARAMTRLYDPVKASSEDAPDQPRDPRAEIKKMILARDAMLIAADQQDPRKFYELAVSIDTFVEEILRKASS